MDNKVDELLDDQQEYLDAMAKSIIDYAKLDNTKVGNSLAARLDAMQVSSSFCSFEEVTMSYDNAW